MEWDFAFTLPYQSTDKSVQSEDNHGGIDPDTDEEKDLRKKPAKVKGKRKAPSKEAWVTHRDKYQALLVRIKLSMCRWQVWITSEAESSHGPFEQHCTWKQERE